MDKLTRRGVLGIGAAAASVTLLPTAVQASARSATPWQTEGPFFPIHEQSDKDADLTVIDGQSEPALGEVVEVSGRIVDTNGDPIAGALVDIWQANAAGRYAHESDPNTAPLDPQFQGWARLVTGKDGSYSIRTIKPGAYPAEEGWVRPPHIHYKVARRGYKEITTQLYFEGDPLNDVDRLLLAVPEPERANLVGDFSGGAATFDVVLARV
jgi:protocatechuate 3,4-dioxygenase beta subunit